MFKCVTVRSFAHPTKQPIVFLWYRPHPAALIATNDQVARPDHADWASRCVVAAILTSTLGSGSHQYRRLGPILLSYALSYSP